MLNKIDYIIEVFMLYLLMAISFAMFIYVCYGILPAVILSII